jgi:hypothetical protein
MKYRLQPEEKQNGTLPYPYYVDDHGLVGRQDFWKGTPHRLIGFNSTPVSGSMDIATFIYTDEIPDEDMMLGVGSYPIFADAKDNWFTSGNQIESIERIK